MRIRTWLSVLLIALVCGVAGQAVAADKTADQIIDEAMEQNSLGFKAGQADLALIIEDKAGDRRVRKLDVKSKKLGGGARTLVTLTAPKEVKGQAFLFAENPDGEDDVWMFVPAFSVTRRIEGSQKKGAFLGSHFTYADLESRHLDEGKHKRLGDEKIGEHAVWVIESTPTNKSTSDYGKVITYVRKSDSMPLKAKFYDKSGDLAKTLFVEKLDKTDDGESYVQQMTLRPKAGGYTTIQIGGFEADADLPDSLFSKDQLGK